jgi:hypothetical protein
VPAPAPRALASAAGRRHRPGDAYLTAWDTAGVIVVVSLFAVLVLWSAV